MPEPRRAPTSPLIPAVRAATALVVAAALTIASAVSPVSAQTDPGAAQADAPTAVRLAGEDAVGTSVAVARDAFPAGAGTVYLARVDVLADALVAGSLTDGPVLLVPSCGPLPTVVEQAVTEIDPSQVVALGGPAAICDQLLADAAAGRPTDRIAGQTRLETAAAIADRAFPTGAPVVYVASAEIGPDAIVGGTLTRGPVLLVPATGVVPTVVLDALVATGATTTFVLGGTAAVAAPVADQVHLGTVLRLAGGSRVQTAAQISRHQFGLGSATDAPVRTVYLTVDGALAEAVATGVAPDGPVLLVPTCDALPADVAAELVRLRPERIVAVGDQQLLCDEVLADAVEAATPDPLVADPDVIPLTSEDGPLLSATSDTVVLQATPRTTALQTGDVVALEPEAELLPAGWVVTVLSATTTPQGVQLAVQPAELDRVLTQGSLRLPPGQPGFDAISASLSVPLCAEGSTDCIADGSITAELTVDLFADIDLDQRTFLLGTELTGKLEGQIEFQQERGFTGPEVVRQLRPIPVPGGSIGFGPFSIGAVFIPAIILEVSGTAETVGTMTLSTEVDGTIGGVYADGSFSLLPLDGDVVGELDGAQGTIRGSVEPKVFVEGLVTFGAGPAGFDRVLSADAEIGIEAPVTVAVDTSATVYCDLEVAGFANLEATLFGREVTTGLEQSLFSEDLCPVPPEGSLREDGLGDLRWGTPETTARGHMLRRYGLPTSSTDDSGSCEDGRTWSERAVTWPEVTLNFFEVDGQSQLSLWFINASNADPLALTTPEGTGFASTRAEWRAAYADRDLREGDIQTSIGIDTAPEGRYALLYLGGDPDLATIVSGIAPDASRGCAIVFDDPGV